MARLGADVAHLDALARRIDAMSAGLDDSRNGVDRLVAAVEWDGPDAEQFRSTWRGTHAAQMRRTARSLDSVGRDLRRQAEQQRQASGNGGGGSPWVSMPAGPSSAVPAGEDPTDGPELIHADPGSPWIPQGQGYDEGRGELLQAYYREDEDGTDVPGLLLSIQDRHTGAETLQVTLAGLASDSPLMSSDGPVHGGGVATDGEYVYVAGDGKIWVYDRAVLDVAGNCSTVNAISVVDAPASSYLGMGDDGTLYAGTFVEGPLGPDLWRDAYGELYSYQLDDGHLSAPTFETLTPYEVQGVDTTDDGYLFSTSYGRDFGSELQFQGFGGHPDDADVTEHLPPLSQAVNIIDGDAWVSFEGAAVKFDSQGPDHVQIIDLNSDDVE